MDELRMQGEGTHRIVGVRVLPGMGHGGVVDGQQLDHVLTGLHRPVHQAFDIVEFSHAKAFFRLEGEHRNGHAGASPGFRGELGLKVGNHHLRVLGRNLSKEMVGSFFPAADGLGLGIDNHKFVLDGFLDFHGDEPPGENVVAHHVDAVPLAQFVPAAHDGQGLMAANLGGGHLDTHIAAGANLGIGMAEGGTAGPAENDVAEGRRIEGRIGRLLHPAGTHDDILSGRRGFVMVLAPFSFDYLAVTDNLEGECVSVVDVPAGEHDLPQPAIGIFHGDAALAQAKLNALAPLGVVLQLDICGHSMCVGLCG